MTTDTPLEPPHDIAAEQVSSRSTVARRGLRETVPLVVVLGLALVLAASEGGFADDPLYVSTLFILATVVVMVAGRVMRRELSGSPSLRVAVVALGGYTLWSFASIAWSDAQAESLRGADRALLYALVFAVVALCPVSARLVVPVLLGFATGVAILVAVTAYRLSSSTDPVEFVIGNRLSAPIGYPNGTAAISVAAAWLCLGLATRRWIRSPVRVVAFGVGTALVLLSLLCQSRGSVFTTPFVVAAFFVGVGDRARGLAGFILVGGVTALVAPRVLDVFQSDTPAELAERVGTSLWLIGLAVVLAVVAGIVLLWIEKVVTISPRTRRIGTGVALGAVVVACVIGAITLHPADRVGRWWDDFKTSTNVESNVSHFGGLGSNRYDFWRVGLREFRDHPIQGIGVDNFQVPYLQERRSSEGPLYPHSLVIDILSQVGLVGSALFATFLVACGWAIVERRPGPARELAAIAAIAALALLCHSSVDWLWEIPAIGVLGMALLGLTFSVSATETTRGDRENGRRRSERAALVVFATFVAVAVVVVLSPWLAGRYTRQAARVWPTSPAVAYSQLRTAHSLNPLSDEADLVAATIAIRRGENRVARDRLVDAVSRFPADWYGQLQLAAVSAALGDPEAANRAMATATRLNPREPVVCLSLRRLREGRPLSPLETQKAIGRSLPPTACGEGV